MRAVVRDAGTKARRLGTSTPLECLEASRRAFAQLIRPGDRIGEVRVTERLVDDHDGEIVLVLEDGSHVSWDAV